MRYAKTLRLRSIMILSGIMIAGNVICGIFWFLLFRLNIIRVATWARLLPPITLLILSVVVGTAITIVFSRRIMLPLHEMLLATRAIAAGDYSVRVIDVKGEGEFQELVRSFNKMAQELQGTEILRNDFIDNFSHEFKTPITSIQGFARRLLKGGLDAGRAEEYLSIIAGEADRLSEMSTGILKLSKLENQALPGEQTDFLLDEQIRSCALALERRWAAKEIDLTLDLPELSYHGRAELLALVWTNLLENAIKFTDNGGKITVSAQIRRGWLLIDVADSGIGMTQETLEHIFDKFYQGATVHSSKGSGLGLSIVRRAMELCGGDVSVESQLGIGTVFRVKLPYGDK